MIVRIPQRTMDDCVICSVAMVTGYTYERVLKDSESYERETPEGEFPAWWETYLKAEGYRTEYQDFMRLYDIVRHDGRVVGLLMMNFPAKQASHIVAVDEQGIVDPATGARDHTPIEEYIGPRLADGAEFHKEFLWIEPVETP